MSKITNEAFEKLVNDSLNNDQKALDKILELSSLNIDQIQLLKRKVTATLNNDRDNLNAIFIAGVMHMKGQGGPINFPEATRLFELAIEKNYGRALNARAFMHEHGRGEPVNFPEAIRLYELAIAKDITAALCNRALMHENGRGGPVNLPEAIHLYELASIKGHVYAMYRLAYIHERGLKGSKNYNVAAKLYRQVCNSENNYTVETARKNMFYFSKADDQDDTSEAAYHICLTFNNDLWQRNPAIFLAYLARDNLLTDKERLAILAKWIRALPNIETIEDQVSIDLIGEYYFQEIAILLSEQWNFKINTNKRPELLYRAINFLRNIPKDAKRYPGACHVIATHCYHLTLANTGDETIAFENAQSFFHQGSVGDEFCQTHYLQLLRSLLRPEEDAIREENILQTITALESEHAEDIRFIKAIPALVSQAILTTENASNTTRSFFFILKDLTCGSRTYILSLRHKFVNALQNDEALLNKNAALTSKETITLARKYLALINETKTQIPFGNYRQEVLQVFDKIGAKIQKCLALHTPDDQGNIKATQKCK